MCYCRRTSLLVGLFSLALSSLWLQYPIFCDGLITTEPVSKLLTKYAPDIGNLKQSAKGISLDQQPYNNDVFFLRYCIETDDPDERVKKLHSTIQWRQGEGKTMCENALKAVSDASSSSATQWTNDPIMSLAPHSATINKYLSDKNMLTTTMDGTDDLVYCIRAGVIDDVALMSELTVEQMTDFFLYAKEVQSLVADARSLECDKLLSVITANDLSGVKLIGGSSDFRSALSASSKKANTIYPATAGPTLLLNLPRLLNALVKLFTPLFPKEVNERLKFAKCDTIKRVESLKEISALSNGKQRVAFLNDINGILS